MQREKLEMEERIQKEKLKRAEKEKGKQYNLRMKELEMQDKVKTKPLDLGTHFDVTKHIRLVPPFQEKEVDKYFLHFENVVENFKWPKEHWTLLLQSVVVGKARKIYTQLSIEQSSDYDKVKELILKAYELFPEAYRQKFRNCRKENDQTHVEFARTKEQLFDKWCSSKKIGGGRVERRCWVNFQCRGVLLVWMIVGQGPIALAVGAGGGCLDIFALIYLFSFLSPSLWETARYRLKYCLKGPLNPKQPTNQRK